MIWFKKSIDHLIFFIFVNFVALNTGCDKNTPKEDVVLQGEFFLDFMEPSGLALSFDKKSLWCVSDKNSQIYNISTSGQIISQMKIDANDLEGICVINDSLLAVVSEETNELLTVDYSGKVNKRYPVILDGDTKYGLEGITYNYNLHRYYLVKEKNPSLLINLDYNFNDITSQTLNISMDLSGIEYDNIENILWILSDENQTISKCDLAGNVLQRFHFNLSKPEGIAIDHDNKLLYVVSDSQQKLCIYKLPE